MKRKITLGIFCIFCVCLVCALTKVILIYVTYQKGNAIYGQIADTVAEEIKVDSEVEWYAEKPKKKGQKSTKESITDPVLKVDFASLQKKNPDIIGWIYIPDTVISYPLLQTTDNEKYLHKTYDLQTSIFGSIFMDCQNQADFSDQHTIIYGHNMRNGSMFGSLKKYYDADFFQKHRKIYIYTPKESRVYQIFSCHVAKAGGSVYQTDFTDGKAFLQFAEGLQKSSYYQTQEELEKDSKLITLSTCTGAEEKRLVLHGIYIGNVVQ